jgi:hypothetical protein
MNISAHFPFPDKALSQNARPGHWAQRSRPAKKYRDACGKSLWAAGIRKIDAEALHVQYTFFPPARYLFDLDGLASRMKSATDSIADATGINDRNFTFGPPVIGGYVKPGHVRVDLTW